MPAYRRRGADERSDGHGAGGHRRQRVGGGRRDGAQHAAAECCGRGGDGGHTRHGGRAERDDDPQQQRERQHPVRELRSGKHDGNCGDQRPDEQTIHRRSLTGSPTGDAPGEAAVHVRPVNQEERGDSRHTGKRGAPNGRRVTGSGRPGEIGRVRGGRAHRAGERRANRTSGRPSSIIAYRADADETSVRARRRPAAANPGQAAPQEPADGGPGAPRTDASGAFAPILVAAALRDRAARARAALHPARRHGYSR